MRSQYPGRMGNLTPQRTPECFKAFQGALTRGWSSRGNSKQITNIQQYLQHQLIPHISIVQIAHSCLITPLPGSLIRVPIDRFKIAKDSVSRAHRLPMPGKHERYTDPARQAASLNGVRLAGSSDEPFRLVGT